MTRFLKGTDRPLAEAYQLALLDLDGVVYRGKNPVEYKKKLSKNDKNISFIRQK